MHTKEELADMELTGLEAVADGVMKRTGKRGAFPHTIRPIITFTTDYEIRLTFDAQEAMGCPRYVHFYYEDGPAYKIGVRPAIDNLGDAYTNLYNGIRAPDVFEMLGLDNDHTYLAQAKITTDNEVWADITALVES